MPNYNKIALCPYYISHRKGKGLWKSEVTCSLIHEHLGFGVRNGLQFSSAEELESWMDMYCADYRFGECLYYRAISQNQQD